MAEDLTVVVVAVAGGEALQECVKAVRAQVANVLLASRDGCIADLDGKRVGMAEHCNIPSKRKRAVELAPTRLVALIEDTVLPQPGWAEAIIRAFEKPTAFACGGPVSIDRRLPASSRALALSEYGSFSDRKPPGTVDALPGCNFAFRRHRLLEVMAATDGLIDQVTFRRLRDLGGELAWSPQMAVTYCHANPEGARLATRFRHGRIYASADGRRDLFHRASAAGKAILLPPLLTLRSLRHARSGERASVPTLGWLVLQHAAWAAGEFTGAVLGPSARGLGEWQ